MYWRYCQLCIIHSTYVYHHEELSPFPLCWVIHVTSGSSCQQTRANVQSVTQMYYPRCDHIHTLLFLLLLILFHFFNLIIDFFVIELHVHLSKVGYENKFIVSIVNETQLAK